MHNAKLLQEVIHDYSILDHSKYGNMHINRIHIQADAQNHRFDHKYNKVNRLDLKTTHYNECPTLRSFYHLTKFHYMMLCNKDNDLKTLRTQWYIWDKISDCKEVFLFSSPFFCLSLLNKWDISGFILNFICFKFLLCWLHESFSLVFYGYVSFSF